MMRIRTIAAWTAAGLALGVVQQAYASGFAIRENSAEALGTAFAGNASSADFLSTIFNNPAGMTQFSGMRSQVDASFIIPHAQFTGSVTESGCVHCFGLAFPVSGSSTFDSGSAALVPATYALYSISPDLKAGLAITSPFGLTTEYANDWVGRYFGITSKIQTIDINPNLAYRVNDWLSIGGGFSAQRLGAVLTNAIDQNSILGFPQGSLQTLPGPVCSNANCDAFLRLDGSDWGFGFNGGILLQPTPQTNVGLTYRSRVHHTVGGTASFSDVSPAVTGASPLLAAALSSSTFSTGVVLPDSVDLSVTQKITDRFHVAADLQWTDWSVFNSLAIMRTSGPLAGTNLQVTPENFHNTVFVAVGGTYNYDDNWTFRAGFAFDETPVRASNITVRLPDGNRYWLATGFGYKFAEGVSVDFGYAHIFLSSSNLNSSVNSVVPGAIAGVSGTDTITGGFTSSVDLVSLQARYKF